MDLPDDLMRAIKLRALQEGKKLNEIMPELLQNGLSADIGATPPLQAARIEIDKDTGFPVIRGGTTPSKSMTPAELSDILLAQEVEAYLRTS